MAEAQAQTADQKMKILAEALWNDAELGEKVQAKAKALFPGFVTHKPYLRTTRQPG
jgi:hypothetical protein